MAESSDFSHIVIGDEEETVIEAGSIPAHAAPAQRAAHAAPAAEDFEDEENFENDEDFEGDDAFEDEEDFENDEDFADEEDFEDDEEPEGDDAFEDDEDIEYVEDDDDFEEFDAAVMPAKARHSENKGQAAKVVDDIPPMPTTQKIVLIAAGVLVLVAVVYFVFFI